MVSTLKDDTQINDTSADPSSFDLLTPGEPQTDIALSTMPAKSASPSGSLSHNAKNNLPGNLAIDGLSAAPHMQLPEANSSEYSSTMPNDATNFVKTAAGFAITMLPRLFNEPKTDFAVGDNVESMDTDARTDSTGQIDDGKLDDGFALTAYGRRTQIPLPSISDAARAQKTLLSLNNEITYIRNSIGGLGIDTNYLPRLDKALGDAQDTDFKQLLITLAEHRAILRKIPFKTPMLYFYISGDSVCFSRN